MFSYKNDIIINFPNCLYCSSTVCNIFFFNLENKFFLYFFLFILKIFIILYLTYLLPFFFLIFIFCNIFQVFPFFFLYIFLEKNIVSYFFTLAYLYYSFYFYLYSLVICFFLLFFLYTFVFEKLLYKN